MKSASVRSSNPTEPMGDNTTSPRAFHLLNVLDTPLNTARLRLSPLQADDAEELAEVLADRELYEFTGGEPMSLPLLRQRFEMLECRHSPDGLELWLNWTLRLRPADLAIGYIQATVVPGSMATIAYVIGVQWQRRGFATEAVREMVESLRRAGVERIRATIPIGHQASGRVASAAGFRKTNDKTPDGEVVWAFDT